jgi:hypothetical protein
LDKCQILQERKNWHILWFCEHSLSASSERRRRFGRPTRRGPLTCVCAPLGAGSRSRKQQQLRSKRLERNVDRVWKKIRHDRQLDSAVLRKVWEEVK